MLCDIMTSQLVSYYLLLLESVSVVANTLSNWDHASTNQALQASQRFSSVANWTVRSHSLFKRWIYTNKSYQSHTGVFRQSTKLICDSFLCNQSTTQCFWFHGWDIFEPPLKELVNFNYLINYFARKCGLPLGAESVQSELLIGRVSVLLTNPTQNYTEGMYMSAMEIRPRMKDCFTSKVIIL